MLYSLNGHCVLINCKLIISNQTHTQIILEIVFEQKCDNLALLSILLGMWKTEKHVAGESLIGSSFSNF